MMTEQTLHLALVGSGGDGVMVTAAMLLRTAARMGFYGMMTQSYGPQIRGGESAAHVTIGTDPVGVVGLAKDLLVVFRYADVGRFLRELRVTPHTAVFYGIDSHGQARGNLSSELCSREGGVAGQTGSSGARQTGNASVTLPGGGATRAPAIDEGEMPELLRTAGGPKFPVPFAELLEREGLPEMTKNVVLFGMLLRALEWDLAGGASCVQEAFAHKGASVVSTNLRAIKVGYQFGERCALPFARPCPRSPGDGSRIVISGNEACAEAAVDAGCRFYAGYPITPSSEILEEMLRLQPTVGGRVLQSEDEIAALGMVIGASYGGVPSMTATSGPGLSLMTEMFGLASMAEIPLVIVDCQRAGPSTGIPSQTEQSDLWHALYGGHGDFPRVVLAPTDVPSCYATMFRAFYCAETFQLPVVVLSDAAIAQRSEIIDAVDTTNFPRAHRLTAAPIAGTDYRRYDLRPTSDAAWSGVNRMAIPGTKDGMHGIAGIEHTAQGTPAADGLHHHVMNQKRFRKLNALAASSADWYECVGPEDAPHAVIAWGSSAAVARQYVAGRNDLALFIPSILHPFPVAGLQRFLRGRKRVSVLEMNYQGQLHHHLCAIGAIPSHAVSLSRSGGLPYQLEEIHRVLQEGGTV